MFLNVKLKAMRYLKYIGFVNLLVYVYWLYLKIDYKTCAEMPQVKEAKRLRLEKYRF